ncbi:hypothetical protein [Puniceibacterium confluentis]|uniref:hypothetical protein n=1 Tax=Puniceibacterium confluentis TaxID=1958944 RepID=UPI0011B57930|nr:hypothetical protein [Puniceibacterium confluentis]
MARTVYLHIGMPKCATTSVQDFLSAERAALADTGLSYVQHPGDAPGRKGNGIPLAQARFARDSARAAEILDVFLQGEGDVLLSSEMFYDLARGVRIAEMFDQIRARGCEVRVICYLRRQDYWIESDFKQQIKDLGGWSEPLSALIAQRAHTRTLNYTWLLMNWARHAGLENVLVEPLVPGQPPDHALHRFLHRIDRPQLIAAASAVGRSNESPPTGLIEAARFLKRGWAARGQPEAAVMAQLAQFFATAPDRVAVPARRFLLPLAERRRLVQRYARVNAVLGQRFLDGGDPFGDALVEDAASEVPLAEEAADVLAQYLLPTAPERHLGDLAGRGLRWGARRLGHRRR